MIYDACLRVTMLYEIKQLQPELCSTVNYDNNWIKMLKRETWST